MLTLRQPRLRVVALAVAGVLVAGVLGAVALGDGGNSLDAGERLLADDSRFVTPVAAGTEFAGLSADLEEAGVACAGDRGTTPRCDAVLAASAYAQVLAVAVLKCPQHEVDRARQELRGHLRAIRRLPPRAERAPDVPAVPAC